MNWLGDTRHLHFQCVDFHILVNKVIAAIDEDHQNYQPIPSGCETHPGKVLQVVFLPAARFNVHRKLAGKLRLIAGAGF